MTGRTRNIRLTDRQASERLAQLNSRSVGSCALCSRRIDGGGALHPECALRAGRCPSCGRDISACRCLPDGAA